MLKVASLALVLIHYTLYNIDNVEYDSLNFIRKGFWYKLATGQKERKQKVNGTLLLLLLNRTRATKKREHCQVLNFPPFL